MNALPLLIGLAAMLAGMAVIPAHADIEYQSEIGGRGSANDELSGPSGVVFSSSDKLLYVVDTGNDRINVFETDGSHDFKFGEFCSLQEIRDCHDNARGADNDGDGQFDGPTAATLDDRDDLFVVDSENGRIQVFDKGRFESKIGSTDRGNAGYLGSPYGIAIHDSERLIYVSNQAPDAIHVFDYDGDFILDFDTFDGRDRFDDPTYLLVDNNILYVADTGNDRIVMFELVENRCPSGTDRVADGVCHAGGFGETGRADGEFDSPSGLALDAENDTLYVADTGNDRIVMFELVENRCPSGTDRVADGVCHAGEFGETGRADGEFDGPSGLALDAENDTLYVADTGNDRVQLFSLDRKSGASPDAPRNMRVSPTSATSIVVSWDAPLRDRDAQDISGYKLEYKRGSEKYEILDMDTKSTATSFLHTGLERNEIYTYRVSAINQNGMSTASSISGKPQDTTTPSGLVADAISAHQVRLSWHAPTDTFNQDITGYEIFRVYSNGVTVSLGQTNAGTTSFVAGNLATGTAYSFAVSALLETGSSDESEPATSTPQDDSTDTGQAIRSYIEVLAGVPGSPTGLTATRTFPSEINMFWDAPESDDASEITGYKIEYKRGQGSFMTLVPDTTIATRTYTHSNVAQDSVYTYRVSAINQHGTGSPSSPVTVPVPSDNIRLRSMGPLSVTVGETLSVPARLAEGTPENVRYSIESNPPSGIRIDPGSGMLEWTPTDFHGGNTYTFDLVAKKGLATDRESVTIMVNSPVREEPAPEPPPVEPVSAGTDTIAPFVDPDVDPYHYINRYETEEAYREWFDSAYPGYDSIYAAVGLEEPPAVPAPFVDPDVDPYHYINRYETEEAYREWFDSAYPEYDSIYAAVGLEGPATLAEPPAGSPNPDDPAAPDIPAESPATSSNGTGDMPGFGACGNGTQLVDGTCQLVQDAEGGGCLIATAAYGTETASQVQLLRQIRDDRLLGTEYGTSFMAGFNQAYYAISPAIADYQRENPAFKEAVRIAIGPLLATLGIMSLAETEQEVLGYGILVISLNLLIYLGMPAGLVRVAMLQRHRSA